jgi:hypothetical protein
MKKKIILKAKWFPMPTSESKAYTNTQAPFDSQHIAHWTQMLRNI